MQINEYRVSTLICMWCDMLDNDYEIKEYSLVSCKCFGQYICTVAAVC